MKKHDSLKKMDTAAQASPPPDPSDGAWLSDLNPQQKTAVTHGSGPLLIVAGAGSGKTMTLAYRVAWLIANGVDPERILLLTFTRRAAEEMLKRASAVMHRGVSATGRVWGGTFHAMANRLLRIYAKAANLDSNFTVMDESDAQDLINVIRHDMGLHTKEKRFPRKSTCLDIYSRRVNGSESLEDVLGQHFPWCAEWKDELKALFKSYVERKQKKNVLDYDDLLLYWMHLLADPRIAELIEARFDHILVDEYQDTNKVQAEILRGMRRNNRNITVVGDDAQSIYSFRAATIRNMLDFPEEFPGTTVVALEQNYRSVMPILTTTNAVIAQAKERFAKELWSVRGEGQKPVLVTCKDEGQQDKYVIERILEHYEQGIPLKRQAVLFRAAYLSDSLEIGLARANIPYHKYGGLRFLEAAHVKDLVAILRIAENPRDEIAWFRLLQLIDGIGPTIAQRAFQFVAENGFNPSAIGSFDVPAAATPAITALAALMSDLSGSGSKALSPAAQVERVRKFYDPMLKKLYDNPVPRSRDIENLEKIASSYKSRARFLVDLQLDPPTSTSDLAGPPVRDEDWLVLSTIHSAKGCEWDVVYLIHAADGCLPSDMATGSKEEIEEELRLTYVAMTRARDFLYVTWPMRYYHKWFAMGDAHSYAQVCRFITPEVHRTMGSVDLADAVPEDSGSDESSSTDIKRRLMDMWQ